MFPSPSASSSTGAAALDTGAQLAVLMLGFLHRAPSRRSMLSSADKAALDAQRSARAAVFILPLIPQVCTSPGFIHPR